MNDLKKFLVDETCTVFDTIKIVTERNTQFAIVTRLDGSISGVVTDGDIRKGILNAIDLKSSVKNIMNIEPKTVLKGVSTKEIEKLVKKFKIRHMPIVDEAGKVVDIFVSTQAYPINERQNSVVIMAGGLGSRLGDLTSNTPKPLLKVGEKPILEIILENFIEYGFRNFYFSVNYKSELIEEYFKDGRDWGVSIIYIKEPLKLGTAGGLSLANFKNDLPIIVMNGDLLTKIDFGELLDFHERSSSLATMCVRKYDFQVPYGVIETIEDQISRIVEKPTHSFFVNAGIYVLEQKLLTYLKKNQYMDMTTLFEMAKQESKPLKVFPVHEYWLDIGRVEDFEKAQIDFSANFKSF